MKIMSKYGAILTLPLLLTFASSSYAALVTQWGFEVDSGFSAFAPGSVTGSNTNTHFNAPTTLTWGTNIGNGLSSLDISGPNNNGNITGSLDTNSGPIGINSLFHNNNAINAPSLTSAVLNTQLVLTPEIPVGSSLDPLMIEFDILFEETTNSEPCLAGSSSICDDIFVVDIDNALYNPATGTIHQSFMYDSETYDAILSVTGLGLLTDAQCDAAGADDGCIGFTTLEGEDNQFDVSLSISTEVFTVPEPSSLAILSLGLLGLVGTRRNK